MSQETQIVSHFKPQGISGRTAGTLPTREAKTGEESAGFLDFVKGLIDMVNPLQHIPVVSTLYRSITGDEIHPAAQVAGGTLYGGPLGAATSIASIGIDAVITDAGMKDTVLAWAGNSQGTSIQNNIAGATDHMLTQSAQTISSQSAPSLGSVLANDIIWDTPVVADAPQDNNDTIKNSKAVDYTAPVAEDMTTTRMLEALDKYQTMKIREWHQKDFVAF